jgi:murein DD-endopeptidase MepM/ murein hydrolase activator NlpD
MRLTSIASAALALIMSIGTAAACEMPAAEAGKSPLQTLRPVVGEDVRLTAGFGMRQHPILQMQRLHTGVDWAAPTGTQVIAAGAGRVVEAGPRGEYGNAILIDHGAGWQTLYGQLSRIEVKQGDCVAAAAPIGKVGSTGLSSGPHLHYEVRRDGKPIDPMKVALQSAPPEAGDNK